MIEPTNSPPSSRFQFDRRKFATLAIAGGHAIASALSANAESPSLADVRPKLHEVMRVRTEIDVKGNVNVAKDPLASTSRSRSFPIHSKATFDYEERPLVPENFDARSEVIAAERYYHEAKSSAVLNKDERTSELGESVRHAIVRRDSLPEMIYSNEGYFTHDELALLRTPVSSQAVEQLLPAEAVTVGDRYQISRQALSSVLNLTSIDSGDVESEVLEVTESDVRFKLKGDFEGMVDGVATRIRVLGKMTFSRASRCCSWLALAIHETRQIGKAEPGFDVAATIKMVRRPLEAPIALPPSAANVELDLDVPAQRLYVELRCEGIQSGMMMDRGWKIIQDTPSSAILRLIEHDSSVAQCNLRSLVELPAEKKLSLDDFETDVRRTLGDRLVKLVARDQRITAQGLDVLRVIADGDAGGVPIRWIMMHFSDQDGRRVQATFTMSDDRIERFGANDGQLADSLRFLAPTAPQPAETREVNEIAARETKDGTSSPSDLK